MTEKGSAETSVDEYLDGLPTHQKVALQALRETIRAAAPMADEVITYGIPGYRHLGSLVSFSAATRHCTFHLMSLASMESHRAELAGYELTKGGIHFTPDTPLPKALVTKLVKARVAENEARAKKK